MEDKIFKILIVYFATSSIILASGWLHVVNVADVNLIPASVSLFLLVPIYVWYRNYRQRTKLSQKIYERRKRAILVAILLLFAAAMLIRIPSVLLLNMVYEKTPVIFLVILTIVFLEGTDPSVFGFKTKRFSRALLLGLIYYLIYEFSIALMYGVLTYAYTGQAIIVGYDPVPFVLTMPFMTFCVGISEEGLFRGYMQTHLRQVYSRRKANLIQAIPFGLWHFVWHVFPLDVFGMLFHITNTFVIGLLFGYFYSESNNLTPLILTHGLIDSFPQGFIPNESALESLQTLPLTTQLLIQLAPFAVSIIITFVSTRFLIRTVLGYSTTKA